MKKLGYIFTKEDTDTNKNINEIELEGKYAILKLDSLSENFREAKYQLVKCVGGFGCSPGKLGNAIFVKECFAPTETEKPESYRRERCNNNFLGIATEKAIAEFKEIYGWNEEE